MRKVYTRVKTTMADADEDDVARALNFISQANLGSISSGESLRQLVQDYFCCNNEENSDDSDDSDEDNGENVDNSDEDSRVGGFGSVIAASSNEETLVNTRLAVTTEADAVLDRAKIEYCSESPNAEEELIRFFSCNCQLNSGRSCILQFEKEDILKRRMEMHELTSGEKDNYYEINCNNYSVIFQSTGLCLFKLKQFNSVL